MEERWITIKGRGPVKIKTTSEYMNNLIRQGATLKASKMTQQQLQDKIIDVVNNGQVIDFSVGPTMTICSVYEDGNYSWLHSDTDSPMFDFERVVVPDLKDEFIVVDDNSSKMSRGSRFKKYGYEEVGRIKERERNIMGDGKYNEKKRFDRDDWGNDWILMKKVDKESKEFTRKDLMNGEPYKGADGYWNIDLKEGYVADSGWNYIWAKTKKEAYNELDSLVRAENKFKKNKEE